jgi:hypothetical protein
MMLQRWLLCPMFLRVHDEPLWGGPKNQKGSQALA